MPGVKTVWHEMSRALLTEKERERIAGNPENEQRRHEAVSRARRRINEELPDDLELLEQHHPTLYDELVSVVCDSSEE